MPSQLLHITFPNHPIAPPKPLFALSLCLVWEGYTCRGWTLKHQVSDMTNILQQSLQFNYLRYQVIKACLACFCKIKYEFPVFTEIWCPHHHSTHSKHFKSSLFETHWSLAWSVAQTLHTAPSLKLENSGVYYISLTPDLLSSFIGKETNKNGSFDNTK